MVYLPGLGNFLGHERYVDILGILRYHDLALQRSYQLWNSAMNCSQETVISRDLLHQDRIHGRVLIIGRAQFGFKLNERFRKLKMSTLSKRGKNLLWQLLDYVITNVHDYLAVQLAIPIWNEQNIK